MYGNFQTCPQLYSAQAPINSVYKHIHFFISRGLGASAHSQGLCAARLKMCRNTTKNRLYFSQRGIIILRKNQSIFIYQSKIAYPVPFLPLL